MYVRPRAALNCRPEAPTTSESVWPLSGFMTAKPVSYVMSPPELHWVGAWRDLAVHMPYGAAPSR